MEPVKVRTLLFATVHRLNLAGSDQFFSDELEHSEVWDAVEVSGSVVSELHALESRVLFCLLEVLGIADLGHVPLVLPVVASARFT